jgi:hypothetical protein
MTRPQRPRSPLAHGTLARCPSCRPCTSCDGGHAEPTAYRVIVLFAAGDLGPGSDRVITKQCTGCGGSARTCLNLRADLEETTPAC